MKAATVSLLVETNMKAKLFFSQQVRETIKDIKKEINKIATIKNISLQQQIPNILSLISPFNTDLHFFQL